jgi:hypothetical protein
VSDKPNRATWSPKLLAWALPRRRRVMRDPALRAMRVPGCPGCEGFGLCAAHAPVTVTTVKP